MGKNEVLNRIVIDPKIMTGKPVIKGTRLTVQHVLGLLSQGIPIDEILGEYDLKKEDVFACLAFARDLLDNTTLIPVSMN